jgi:catechol 2,3-dioxygenase-like lactoylglutathione lyase family enzyme
MIDHTGLVVRDFELSKTWYQTALAPPATSSSWKFPHEAAAPMLQASGKR